MGIDVYMKWKGQTEEEHKAQITGFSIAHGHAGYLREAYHGDPYATQVLFPEAWTARKQDEELGLPVKAATLRKRLPDVIKTAIERGRIIYGQELTESSLEIKSFKDFVELAERIEASGKKVYISVSA